MEQKTNLIRVGISIGDVNGIGPEVIIKSLNDHRILQDFIPIIYGSTRTISYHKKLINEDDFNYQSCKNAEEAILNKVNIINVWNDEIKFDLGQVSESGGKYAFMALERATQDLASNKIDVLVTAPICKEAIKLADFNFPGHTEYLAHLSNVDDALMMMVSPILKVALVTSHIPLKEVSAALTKEKISAKLTALEQTLKKDFGLLKPRIAVLGLNPHAGENSQLGNEENDIIKPVIKQHFDNGALIYGPYPADGFFGSSLFTKFDAVLGMYHDQVLTGFKALTFDEGVNYTAGLPIVRTSPDHGTAFDIVGKGIASPNSFRNAIYLAIDIYKMRKFIKENNTNPLTPQKQTEIKRRYPSRE